MRANTLGCDAAVVQGTRPIVTAVGNCCMGLICGHAARSEWLSALENSDVLRLICLLIR